MSDLNRHLKAIIRRREISEESDLSDCAYYRGMGTCSYGCWEEPACQTEQPLMGWPLDRPWFPRTQRSVKRFWTRLTCKHTLKKGKTAFRPVYTRWGLAPSDRVAEYDSCVFCGKRRPR